MDCTSAALVCVDRAEVARLTSCLVPSCNLDRGDESSSIVGERLSLRFIYLQIVLHNALDLDPVIIATCSGVVAYTIDSYYIITMVASVPCHTEQA